MIRLIANSAIEAAAQIEAQRVSITRFSINGVSGLEQPPLLNQVEPI